MSWQFTSDKPIFSQLTDKIVSCILAGEYKAGEKLPSVRELAVIAAVNPNTAQRAMSELEELGLVDSQRNTGKFVTTDGEKIELVRALRGQLFAARYKGDMRSIGYSRGEATEILEKEYLKEEASNE